MRARDYLFSQRAQFLSYFCKSTPTGKALLNSLGKSTGILYAQDEQQQGSLPCNVEL